MRPAVCRIRDVEGTSYMVELRRGFVVCVGWDRHGHRAAAPPPPRFHRATLRLGRWRLIVALDRRPAAGL